MNFEKIYQKLPIPLQSVALNAEGFRVNRARYDAEYETIERECLERRGWTEERIVAFRDKRLIEFVRYAFRNIPYYVQFARKEGIDPEDFVKADDLRRLPILTKSVVRENPRLFMPGGLPPVGATWLHTSGTTGAGLRFPADPAAVKEQWAVWWRYRNGIGIDFNSKCGYFGGRSVVSQNQTKPPFWRYNIPAKQMMFSGYHLGPETAGAYLNKLARFNPQWIHGYPSLISLLASYALEMNFDSSGMKWVTTGAESLLPHQAEIIGRAFGTLPFEHYGMAEGVANISMCPERRLHVDEDYSSVEFEPHTDGGFRIIGTNFTNPFFPLIRYDTGDIAAEIPNEPCPCGLPGRTIRSIDGRIEDYIITRTGRRIGRLDHIFKDQTAIREARIKQSEPGVMTVSVVKADSFSDRDDSRLREEIIQRVGDDVAFVIEYVRDIEKTASGKLRLVVSQVKEGKIS